VISYTQTGVLAGIRTASIIVISIAGGAATIFTFTAFFGTTWWLFDYFANFRWHMLWLLVASAVLYTFTSGGLASVIFVIAAVVNAWLIAPLWLGDQPEPVGNAAFSVVQVDLSPSVDNAGVISRWLAASSADLLLVSGTTEQRMESVTGGDSPYTIISSPGSDDRLGLVILSLEPWPVEESLTEGFADAVYRVTVSDGLNTTEIVTAWGSMGSNSQAAERLDARLQMVAEVVSTATNPVAVIGNLGATRWATGMTSLRNTHGLRDAFEGSGYAPTWSLGNIPFIGKWAGLPIDAVMMTGDITPLTIVTGPDIGAGHLPVTVEIARAATS